MADKRKDWADEELPADVGRRRFLQATLTHRPAEVQDIDTHAGPFEIDGVPLGVEPVVTEGGAEHGQRAAQCGARLLLVVLRPEQRRERGPPLRLPGHGQER